MFRLLPYRSGSVIYFQGDTSDKIYIVQKGGIRITYQDVETGNDEHETLQPGEFFGVKSALGRYNREETAVAVQDSVVMGMTSGEFEQFAGANTRIIMKMLKVFSNQLRRVHRQVTNLMANEEQPNPEAGLFSVGDYYLKNKRYAEARYVFSRYLAYYPSGANAGKAVKRLEAVKAALSRRGVQAVPPVPADTDFTVDFGDDFDSGTTSTASASEEPDTAKAYSYAASLIAQGKYQQAYTALQGIIESGAEPEYAVQSSFDQGRCLFFMGQTNECIQHLNRVISTYPKHPQVGAALFFLGQAYEKMGLRAQAAAFYKKVLSIVTDETNRVYVNAKQALEAMVD
ncbi:MAG: cyclic nucleotide-binding domain-containing protein [Spirochaetaceae bacterium]|jgi:CRP-like cAMP-binding protein|nr:cyclic nucleotide-binding domain-containing protein [Spirochaetaceae bacterium]